MQLSGERLKHLLHYDPDTGIWTWLVKPWKGPVRVGDVAAKDTPGNRYPRIKIDGVMYSAHRLIWLYMTGNWPTNEIDHIDLNKKNNKWNNIREARRQDNARNMKAYATSGTGIRGVSVYKRSRSYVVRIRVDGVRHYLGSFECPAAAACAYAIASDTYHGEFGRVS